MNTADSKAERHGNQMNQRGNHITRTISSQINIRGDRQTVWNKITNVQIEEFSHPTIFQLLDIPKPLRAEIIADGVGGRRVAYFDNQKRFVQEILIWNPLTEYSFSFNPERGFRVAYFFDLAEGVFQIPTGSYYLSENGQVTLALQTTYSIHKYLFVLLYIPVTMVLKIFQRFLLTSIKKNSEK
jgi:hypothetical protein